MTAPSESALAGQPEERLWLNQPHQLATLACLLEASAPKPGNVHRSADFEDLTFYDFQTSALVIGDVFQRCHTAPLGKTIFLAVEATQQIVGTNTNLGLILLLTPLVKACQGSQPPQTVPLCQTELEQVLQSLTPEDGRWIFEAIRLANPGGMGSSDVQDVFSTEQPINLLEAMEHSSSRDSVARQYAHGFEELFSLGQQLLGAGRVFFSRIDQAIVFAHVGWLALQGDTLIARKCGQTTSDHARTKAIAAMSALGLAAHQWESPQQVADALKQITVAADNRSNPLSNPLLDSSAFWERVAELDFWMRSDGHRRNPGTTADLIGASLFIALCNQQIQPPFR